VRSGLLTEVNTLQLDVASALNPNVAILSAQEVGKLLQLPTAQLQDAYADFLETIEHREVDVSDTLTDAHGLYMGSVTHKGTTSRVYFPVTNHDELCLPRIVIGGMGQGKTKGLGATFAVECLRHGYTSFAIDVARGELGDCVEAWAHANGFPNRVIRLRFGETALGLDWCEIGTSSRAANQFSQEVLAFFNRQGADPGLETKRYIRLAAKTVAIVGDHRLADIARLFTDKEHLQTQMHQLRTLGRDDIAEEWVPFIKLSEGMRGKVLEPVLNRLDLLLGDDYLRECLNSTNSLDLRQWISDGYAVIFDVPKHHLGEDATDILCALLVAKVWLATLSRDTADPNPAFLLMDEPHQYMSSAAHWRSMVVESRKWRLGLVWMFHAWEQIPRDLAAIIKGAGPHFTLYQPTKQTFLSLSAECAPFELGEALKIPRHHALNLWRTGGRVHPPFIAQMPAPPDAKKVQV